MPTTLLDQVLAPENLKLACADVLRAVRKKKSIRYDGVSLVHRAKILKKKDPTIPLNDVLGHEISCAMGVLRKKVLEGKYQRGPLYLHRSEKPKGGFRYLMIHGALDDKILERAVYQVVGEPLRKKLDNGISFCGIPAAVIDPKKLGLFVAHSQIADFLKLNECWIMKADIEKFFDKLDRTVVSSLLADHLSDTSLIPFFSQWLDIKIANLHAFPEYPVTDLGIPQGSCLSGIVSNLYLLSFDKQQENVPGIRLFRYADDLFFACDSLASLEDAKLIAERSLSALGLNTKKEKFEIASPGETFEVLGYEYELNKIGVPDPRLKKWIQKLGMQFARIGKVAYAIRNKKLKPSDIATLYDAQNKLWQTLRAYDATVRPVMLTDSINRQSAAKSASKISGYICSSAKGINRILGKNFVEIQDFREDGKMIWPYVYPRVVGLTPKS